MKHAEFIQYLSEIEDLNSKQRKQLSAVLQGKIRILLLSKHLRHQYGYFRRCHL